MIKLLFGTFDLIAGKSLAIISIGGEERAAQEGR